MRGFLMPVAVSVVTVATMLWQSRTEEPVLCEAPEVRLVEIPGFTSEVLPQSEAELRVLPADTLVEKRRYADGLGGEFLVTVVVGGRTKSSIHRPEMCLPAQGFQMSDPRGLSVDGVDWHAVTLGKGMSGSMGFAYTFFNQAGFRTCSHVRRIFRDVWDRSIVGRIDRWVMVTVLASEADDRRLAGFLGRLGEVVR